MGRMLAWFGVAAGAVYLIYIGGGWWGIYSPYLRIATMAIAAVALGAWFLVAWRDPSWRPTSVMWPAIAACLGSLGISTAFSRVPRVSLEYLAYAVVLAALYLLLVRLFAKPFFRRRLATLATLLFVVTSVAFLLRVGGYWVHWWDTLGRIALPPLRPGYEGLTYNNPSAVLTMVALLAAPAAATVGIASRRAIAAVLGIVATVGIVAVISGSRAGWLALGLTAVITPVVWLLAPANRAVFASGLGAIARRPAARVVALGVVAVVAVAVVAVAPAIVPRLISGGEPERIGYAIAAIRIFGLSPIVGTGPGSWVIERPQIVTSREVDYYIPHAHNLELQTLAELGLVGAAAGAVLVANLLWLLRRSARSEDLATRRWAWFGGIALLYFALHQLLDFYANMPAFLFAAALPIAWLDAAATEEATVERRRRAALPAGLRRAGQVVGVGAIALAIGGLLLQEIPAVQLARAVDAANARDWTAADAPARNAAAMDPEIGSYQLVAGLTAARAGDHAAAAAYFERLTRTNSLPEAWLDLAAEQLELGRSAEAAASLEEALRVGYQRPVVAMPAGELALRLGRLDLADMAFTNTLLRLPSLAADPWWSTTPERKAALERAASAAASAAADPINWELALMAGDIARANGLAAQSGDPVFAARVVAAWNGDSAAADALVSECLAHPLSQYQLLWCARIDGHRRHDDNATRLMDLANTSFQSSYVGGAEVRVSDSGMVGTQLIGNPADLWATYTYRRPAPWDILVPSLLHLKLA